MAVLVACAASLGAQDFAELYRRAEGLRARGDVDAAAVRAAYAAAAAAFAALPAHAAERRAVLPDAAFAALHADAPAQAAAWIAESLALGRDDARHAEIQVQALALAGRAPEAVLAMHHHAPLHRDAVLRAVGSVQARAGGALCEAADAALRRGSVEPGLLVFQLQLEASQRHPIALANLALALRHLGRVAESERCYREALAAAPDDADLWNDLGLLLKGEGRDDEAVAAFVRSRALEAEVPPSGPATSNLVTMTAAGRVRDASARLPDPPAALAGVLARHPDAAMARRLLLRELLAAPFPGRRADSKAAGR